MLYLIVTNIDFVGQELDPSGWCWTCLSGDRVSMMPCEGRKRSLLRPRFKGHTRREYHDDINDEEVIEDYYY